MRPAMMPFLLGALLPPWLGACNDAVLSAGSGVTKKGSSVPSVTDGNLQKRDDTNAGLPAGARNDSTVSPLPTATATATAIPAATPSPAAQGANPGSLPTTAPTGVAATSANCRVFLSKYFIADRREEFLYSRVFQPDEASYLVGPGHYSIKDHFPRAVDFDHSESLGAIAIDRGAHVVVSQVASGVGKIWEAQGPLLIINTDPLNINGLLSKRNSSFPAETEIKLNQNGDRGDYLISLFDWRKWSPDFEALFPMSMRRMASGGYQLSDLRNADLTVTCP